MICLTGSPPPMRGKGSLSCRAFDHIRITPAYAGKSTHTSGRGDRAEDHPRLCGEKINVPHESKAQQGSPPPMRGKAQCPYKPHGTCRITPAYAGKRLCLMLNLSHLKDHPRLCGEKKRITRHKIKYLGITPAYAGKSQH